MSEKKKSKKKDSTQKKTSPSEGPSEEGIKEMLPTGALDMLDGRIDARIDAALERFKPEVAEAVRGAIQQVMTDIQKTGGVNPALIPGLNVPEGGVVPGSPVTPMGAQLLNWITKSDQSSDMENLAKTLTQARAISDVLNPPTIWDRVMQNAVLRSLSKAGLVTDSEMKELLTPPAKP